MLTEFNEGGSHESNPNGGILQGQSSNGQMNTVEQGETKAGQFVYSDRLYINEDLAKQMNLPGYIKGKSFASASKAINNKFKDRNDIHTKATQKELLDRLAQSQEQLKAEQEAINKSMQVNQAEMQYPEETTQFEGGGFMDFIGNNGSSIGNMGSQLGTMLNPNGYNGEDITKASNAGFENKHLQKADKYAQGLNMIQGQVAKSFGPVGEAVFGAKKLGENIGGAIGGDVGAGVKSFFSPEKSAITNWTDPDMKFGDKVLGHLPVIGGIKAKQSADKKLQTFKDNKARVDNFYKYQFNENNDDTQVYALGGEIDPPTKSIPIPTKKDSLNVLNRSIENEKAYLDKGYKMTNSYPVKPDLYDNMLKKSNQIADKQKRNQPTNLIQNGTIVPGVLDPKQYRKDLGNGTFENREIADTYLNMDVKPSLFHENIKPITQKVYTSPDGKDIVSIPSYNAPEFTNSLNKKEPVQAQVPIVQNNIVPAKVPVVNSVPSKRQVIREHITPVADTLQRQNYGVSDIQQFKSTKFAKKDVVPDKKTQSNFDSFMKERTNKKAYGGPLDEVTPPDTFPNGIYQAPQTIKEFQINQNKNNPNGIRLVEDGKAGPMTYTAMGLRTDGSEFPMRLDPNRALNSALETPDSEVKPDYTLDDIKNMESSYNATVKDRKPFDFKQVSDKFGNALRYAPVLGNILQKNKIGPAEVESAIKNPYQYKKQYIDEAQYRNAADQQAALSMEALNKSGLSGNQLMAASLGSQLERTKGVAEGAMAAKMHNLNENKIAEQVKQQNEGDFVADRRRINDVNAQNRANRDTQISKFDSEIYNSLGEIGKEELFKKQAEKLTGYKMMGEYMMADPNYKSQYDAIQKDSKLTPKEKYAKEQKLIQEYYKGFDSKAQEQVSNSLKETATAGHAYGGYMSPKFKKY